MAERGSYVGTMILLSALIRYSTTMYDRSNETSTNAAPSFGPVIAGALTYDLNWRWIFWFSSILTGLYLLIVLTLLPETQRKIVGNGSTIASFIHRSFFDILTRKRRTKSVTDDIAQGHRSCRIPNPFKCLALLLRKGNCTIILVGSITYAVKMTLQASLGTQCIDIYNLNYLQAGLIYLPSGVGGAVAAILTGPLLAPHISSHAEKVLGRLLDNRMKKFAARHGRDAGYRRGDDLAGFPIEEARFSGMWILVLVSAVSTAAYGVCLNERVVGNSKLMCTFISLNSSSTSQPLLSCSS